ncbi:MAG: BatA domain-containing protein, partial [Lentisphaeria bacterium]|nr:BatA domain-containing protein [Lentisphaeria bacterium]
MEFLSPLFLVGTLSAAIPLIIHLSRSRRTKKIRFSTTRFLTDQFLRSYRMSRIKELPLLLARMLLFALLAIALAQPFIRPANQPLMTSEQPRTVVFVLDNSASMGYIDDGVSLFDRARGAAIEIVDSLQQGDRAAIVMAGRRAAGPELVFAEPTPELGDVRQVLDTVQVSDLDTDLSRAVALADKLVLIGSREDSREIYILSDLQDSGWEVYNKDEGGGGSLDTSLFFVSVRPAQPRNLAITAVQYAAPRPMVGIPFTIRPHIHNHDHKTASSTVELHIDNKKVGERQVEGLQPGRWVVSRFHHTFETGGWHTGYVQIDDGTLAADNRRYFAFEVLDAMHILVVNGAPSSVRRLDELFFLQAALGATAAGEKPIQLDIITPDRLADSDLGNYPMVILANVESAPPQAVTHLESFVDGGGGLLIFLGDKTNAAFLNQSFSGSNRLHGGLLPGPVIGMSGDPDSESQLTQIGQIDGNHVVLSSFDDGRTGSFSSVNLKAFWDLDPGEASVLMRTDTGAPLLCEHAFGEGTVMVFASSCDRDWTNFPVRPAFLPWIYRLVGYLSQDTMGHRNFFQTGDDVPVPVSATSGLRQLLVRKPDGTIGTVGTTSDPSAPLAFTGSGFLLGTPVFFDTVFYLMIPLGKALAMRFRENYGLYIMT